MATLDLTGTFDAVVEFITEYGVGSFWRLPRSLFVPLILAEFEARTDIDPDRLAYVLETIYEQGNLQNPGRRYK